MPPPDPNVSRSESAAGDILSLIEHAQIPQGAAIAIAGLVLARLIAREPPDRRQLLITALKAEADFCARDAA